jgi:[acyl-carrier-protein] S-malonyltransferase
MRDMHPDLHQAGDAVAVVFPGQGSQRAGMGRDFCERFAVARDVFVEASDALGLDLRAICFAQDPPDPRLDRTEFTQPAILATEIAMLRALKEESGLAPTYFGGHSLGEYTALCAAGVLPLDVAVRVVRRRGALMQAAVPAGEGAMIALSAPRIAARDLAADFGVDIDVANRNSPDQVVLSGAASAIDQAAQRAEEGLPDFKPDVVRLNVSAPFHSRAMRVIEPELGGALMEHAARINPSHAYVVTSNLTGAFHKPELAPLVASLVGQASGGVDWIANMHALARVAKTIYEVGPNRPLRGFFRAIGRDVIAITSTRSITKELCA